MKGSAVYNRRYPSSFRFGRINAKSKRLIAASFRPLSNGCVLIIPPARGKRINPSTSHGFLNDFGLQCCSAYNICSRRCCSKATKRRACGRIYPLSSGGIPSPPPSEIERKSTTLSRLPSTLLRLGTPRHSQATLLDEAA